MRGGKGKSGLLPSSLRIISSCLKTVSSNAGTVASTVRSAGASVAASIAVSPEDVRDQVLWVGFDKLEICPGSFKHVLLVGYSNGFQVVDIEDASNVCELVSKRDGPVTFLQIQPVPAKSEGSEGFRASHPLLLVVAGDETNGSGAVQGGRLSAFVRESASDSQSGNCIYTPTVVRFYSLKSHSYVHVLRFRSAVYIVRCSPRIVAVSLAAQIYCFDAVTLENKFSVLTFPLQGSAGVNIGYGPMAVGPRWLAYSPNNPLLSNTGRLSPQNLTPSPGISPSTSPGNGTLVARYAMESSKQLAAGLLNLGDMGYKTLSKYCHEFIPDGSSSPSSPNSSRRIVKVPSSIHPNEAENAGMVVVKDFITKDVISQFRAHTSPISALCFDPSGTLLVTASVQGHSINVFRIMPGPMPNGSSSGRYDWTSSHTHLYKLYRGITSAIIQDICFSDYSQWIAIVSSRGTCHIFVLSPFGGDSSLQQNTDTDGPSLIPNYLPPWWTTSTCMMDKQCFPPPPLTLSVVSRIKGGNLGWLNTVSNVAASATGKTTAPSGAIAAVFHNSIYRGSSPVHLKFKSLEHLLVYSPSGHVIQHELQPASSVESSDSSSRNGSSSSLQLQDEELHVNAEPVQWWDVCRRANWLEREQSMSRIKYANQQNIETVMDTLDSNHSGSSYSISSTNSMAGQEFVKPHERHNWYLSNAEVQTTPERIPIWQKPQICFYVLESLQADVRSGNDCSGGEVEIEKLLVHEVEIRRKDLVPALEQFRSSQADWIDRRLVGAHQGPSVEYNKANKFIQETGVIHSKSALVASGLTAGFPWTAASQLDSDGVCLQSVESIPQKSAHSSNLLLHSGSENGNISSLSAFTSARIPRKYSDEECASLHSEHSDNNSPMDECVINGISSSPSSFSHANELVIAATHSSNNGFIGELSGASIEQSGTADSHSPVEFTKFFHEGYCKVSELDDCRDSTDAVTDVDSSSSHCEREKPDEEDGDNDDMLGGVFDFSEEG